MSAEQDRRMNLVEWMTAILNERERGEHSKRKFTTDYWGRPCPECGDPVTGIGLTELTIEHRVDDRRHKCYVSQEVYDEFNGVESNPDPAGLADIASKRAIIELHKPKFSDDENYPSCPSCIKDWTDYRYEPFPCPTVRALASAYRHAPGWEEAWGPT